ncbi:MAG: tRNA (guanosine(37)-N1)-methyltransferase TrmD [Candidatus Omnitrophota bacterium]
MRIDIITIFPNMFAPVLNESIIKRAQQKGLLKIDIHDLRDYSLDKHKKVDDRPFGGGPGMVMRLEPIFRAVEAVKRGTRDEGRGTKVVLLSPQGGTLNQKIAKQLAKNKHLILICGHYEGIDERVRQELVDKEISIGDYVLTGGELPAMVLLDAVSRFIPGVLGHADSTNEESFTLGLLEYPHYTRPADFKGLRVPNVLLTGDHKKIANWRKAQALEVTKNKRPDLLMKTRLSER